MFDPQKFYLGSLCKRGHRWQDTEQSLRRKRNRNCVECEAEHHKRRKTTSEGKASISAADKRYRQSERRKEYLREYRKRPKAVQYTAEKARRYRQTEQGKTARKKADIKHAHTERRRISEERKRAKRKLLVAENREFYGKEEVQALFAIFDNACAYCGVQVNLTMDHFVPLHRGGFDAIWNIVPACLSCNASKQDDCAESWYKSRPFYSEQRWQLILEATRSNKG